MTRQETDFQQRIVAGTVTHDPELKIANALFGEPQATIEESPDNAEEIIVYPTTDEEFQEMLHYFERLDSGP